MRRLIKTPFLGLRGGVLLFLGFGLSILIGGRIWPISSRYHSYDRGFEIMDNTLAEYKMDNTLAEYKEALSLYQFYHDYRMKIFRVFVVFNGALLLATVEYVDLFIPKLIISSLAAISTVTIILLEIRTINFANTVWSHLVEMERLLDFKTMTLLKEYADSHRFSQRFYIKTFYGLCIFIWIVSLFFSK